MLSESLISHQICLPQIGSDISFLTDALFLLAFIGVVSFLSVLLKAFLTVGLCSRSSSKDYSEIGTQAARMVLEGTYLSMGANVLAFQQI